MIIDMVVAPALTKVPILWGQSALFAGEQRWWDFAHESRPGEQSRSGRSPAS
ncbi:hypothetical protein [Nonomuraea sp. 10N515B]|uniref:hypothetical protein n=1 Tax=Nonomuraea sp. 10N515B TaxID=3457422 RepID=UPI003FCD903C